MRIGLAIAFFAVLVATGCITGPSGSDPVAVIEVAPMYGSAPLEVFFDGTKSHWTQGNEGGRFDWDFGDGSVSDAPKGWHAYVRAGRYNVCLTYGNADYNDRACKEVLVQ